MGESEVDRYDCPKPMKKSLSILSKAFGSAVGAEVKQASSCLSSTLVSAAVADPVSRLAGILAKVLIEELFNATNSIERKLDVQLREPLQTAVTIVSETLSYRTRGRSEATEQVRQLRFAFDKLRAAYSYAEVMDDHDRAQVVRLYQCVVASLIPGGKQYLRRWLPALRMEAQTALSGAKDFARRAGWMEEDLFSGTADRSGLSITGEDKYMQRMYSKSLVLKEFTHSAEHLRTLATSITLFCDFVDVLAENRRRIVSP